MLAVLAAGMLAPGAAEAQDPSIAAAGDIACSPSSNSFNGGAGTATGCRHRYTSDTILGGGFSSVLALGDTQYENGEYANFLASYDPAWGRVKSITRPAIGNHEYHDGSGSPLGSGYFDYFNGAGAATGVAGDRDKGYYSFNVGRWHLIALNSNCAQIGGCGAGSAQERWLREDLFTSRGTACTLAYMHHPLFSSGGIGNNPSQRPLWQALYDAGADVVLAGHDHNYERFAPQDPGGVADPPYGIREFVVGTGGKSLLDLGTRKANSEALQNTAYGILALTLHPASYDFRFLPEVGSAYSDAGTGSCHGGPPGALPFVTTTRAATVTDRVATLAGTVNPSNQPTAYHFEYGRTRRYGSSTPTVRVGANDALPHTVQASLRLRPHQRIYYRLVAENAAGTKGAQRKTVRTFARRGAYARAVARTFGLAAYWRLGESRGKKAINDARTFEGRYRGRRKLKRPGAVRVDRNTAVALDGGEVVAKSAPLSRTGTLEGWFLWQGGSTLMRDGTKGGKSGWILAYDDNGRLAYRVAGKSFKTRLATSAVRGRWHHFALVKNGSHVSLHVDGKRVHRGKGASNRRQRGSWHVMRNGNHRGYARGRADEIAVYTVPVPSRTILRHVKLRRRR